MMNPSSRLFFGGDFFFIFLRRSPVPARSDPGKNWNIQINNNIYNTTIHPAEITQQQQLGMRSVWQSRTIVQPIRNWPITELLGREWSRNDQTSPFKLIK